VQTLQFDASGTSKTNSYTQAKITESSWTDIIAQPKNYFSIPGDSGNGRHWYINRNYSGCGNDAGWLVVDRGSHPCTWESKHDPSISILYAVPATYQNWNAAGIAEADVFAIFVR
jgi:hypothetical protein